MTCSRIAALLLLLAVLCSAARAQPCEGQWVPGDGFAGVRGSLNAAINWDPDGSGPRPPLLVVAGAFTIAGNMKVNNIAAWDGAAWTSVGDPQLASVSALAVRPDGRLVAAGTTIPSYPAGRRNIAQWDGSSWTTLASGPNHWDDIIYALAILPNGDLVAGGRISSINGVAMRNIARWNGASWVPFGAGMDYPVRALLVAPGGDLLAGGDFFVADTVAANRVARWNGAAWSPLGSGVNGFVHAMTFTPAGDLIVAGRFTQAGGADASRIARWDGTAWSPLGAGLDADAFALVSTPNGVYVGGDFQHAGGHWTRNIARWDGAGWSPVGLGNAGFGTVLTLTTMPGGGVVAGGGFTSVDGRTASGVALWDGAAWSALGTGNGGAQFSIWALTPLPGGDIAAGGLSQQPSSGPMSSAARWSNGVFSPFGPGLSNRTEGLATLPNGDPVAFTNTVQPPYIYRWDGVSWSALGGGTDGKVFAMHVMANGDLIAGGQFNHAGGVPARCLARWNGTAWSAVNPNLSDPSGPVTVDAIISAPNGDLIVAAGFPPTDSVFPDVHVARWDGTAWTRLGPRFNGFVSALELLPDGGIIAAGSFFSFSSTHVQARHIARWNGSAWSQLGPPGLNGGSSNGAIYAMIRLPSGDLVAAGDFTTDGTQTLNRIARWDGSAWRPLGAGLTLAGSGFNPVARALIPIPGGFAVGGDFVYAGGQVSPSFARYLFPSADFNHDGDTGTDQDIEAFFACLGGHCCPLCGSADFNNDGDTGTDQDIEAFFRVLGGGSC